MAKKKKKKVMKSKPKAKSAAAKKAPAKKKAKKTAKPKAAKKITKAAKKTSKKSKSVTKSSSAASTKPKQTKTLVLNVKPVASAATASKSSGLKVGQVVPDFQAQATSGLFKLSSFKGKKVVLYFYPKDNTSGCTLEGRDFTDALNQFSAKNTVVFGISKDSIKSHQGFIEKQSYKHNLISDENEKVCQLFGVIKEKSMYGRTYMGIERSTFLIDENGVLKHEWREVKVEGHVKDVLSKV